MAHEIDNVFRDEHFVSLRSILLPQSELAPLVTTLLGPAASAVHGTCDYRRIHLDASACGTPCARTRYTRHGRQGCPCMDDRQLCIYGARLQPGCHRRPSQRGADRCCDYLLHPRALLERIFQVGTTGGNIARLPDPYEAKSQHGVDPIGPRRAEQERITRDNFRRSVPRCADRITFVRCAERAGGAW